MSEETPAPQADGSQADGSHAENEPAKRVRRSTDAPPTPEQLVAQRSEDSVQKTRAWAGLGVVVVGDIAIAVAAIFAVAHVSGSTADTTSIAAILSSAFTAIGTMTTAYFGIRAASNTAQSAVRR